jgi:hypothetical protein
MAAEKKSDNSNQSVYTRNEKQVIALLCVIVCIIVLIMVWR